MAAWHALMIGKLKTRKTWRVLARHLLFELRECPTCKRPVLRWRRFDEIKQRIYIRAIATAGGCTSLAARRLRVSRRTLYDYVPIRLRKPGDPPTTER